MNKDRIVQITSIVFSVFVYLVCAINSLGFHHEDEHYQIIEFSEYRNGIIHEVNWEYDKKIRSSIQPIITSVIFFVLRETGIVDHYHLALALRVISATLALFAITVFTRYSANNISEKNRTLFKFSNYLLWFIPYIGVRFSSENWSGIFVVLSTAIAISLTLHSKLRDFLLLGILLGFSTLFRFQCIIIVLGLISWFHFVLKLPTKKSLVILIGFFAIFTLGFILDSFFYREFTFTFYNYVNFNVIKDVAKVFGTSPWYEIIIYIIRSPSYPIGIVIFTCLLAMILLKPKSLIIWVIIPFIILHIFSPHKELRFLFPIALLSPFLVFSGLDAIESKIVISNQNLRKTCFTVLTAVNIMGLYVIMAKSPRRGETEISFYLHKKFGHHPLNLISSFENNPFEPRMNFERHFYKDDNITVTPVNSLWDKDFRNAFHPQKINLLLISHEEYTGMQTKKRLEQFGFQKVKETSNTFISKILEFYDYSIEEKQLSLYQKF